MKSSSNPSSSWKTFGGRIPPQLAKAIRMFAVEKETSVQDLLVEALKDLMVKYGRKVPKE